MTHLILTPLARDLLDMTDVAVEKIRAAADAEIARLRAQAIDSIFRRQTGEPPPSGFDVARGPDGNIVAFVWGADIVAWRTGRLEIPGAVLYAGPAAERRFPDAFTTVAANGRAQD